MSRASNPQSLAERGCVAVTTQNHGCLEMSLGQRLRPAVKNCPWTRGASRARGAGLAWLTGGGRPHTATGCWTPRLPQHELPAQGRAVRRPGPVTGQSPECPKLAQRTEQSRCGRPCRSGHVSPALCRAQRSQPETKTLSQRPERRQAPCSRCPAVLGPGQPASQRQLVFRTASVLGTSAVPAGQSEAGAVGTTDPRRTLSSIQTGPLLTRTRISFNANTRDPAKKCFTRFRYSTNENAPGRDPGAPGQVSAPRDRDELCGSRTDRDGHQKVLMVSIFICCREALDRQKKILLMAVFAIKMKSLMHLIIRGQFANH